jgi:hypothetical protein
MSLGRLARAADSDALLEQMTTLNAAALEDYSNGDFDKAKSRLLQAVALGKKDPNLQGHPMLARTYVHLGALYVDGIEDRKAGVGYFVKALKLKPDIEVTEALLTKSVQSAFDTARAEAKVDVKPTAKEATAAAPAAAGAAPAGTATAALPPSSTKVAATEAKAKDRAPEVAVVAAKSEKAEKADAKTAAADKKKADAASRDKEKQAQVEREKQQKDLAALAALKDSETKERAAKEKLLADKAAAEKALTDTRAQVAQLEKDKAERDKAVAAEKDKVQKDLAAVAAALAALKDSEAKERAAKEKLIAEKAVTDKALSDTRAQVLQLEKDKAERDKQLAEAGTREKREREAKEKLLAEKQAAETREKERKAEEDAARQVRAKLAEGPDVPAHFAEPIHCNLPDEVNPETDVFVHCLAKPGLAAKDMAIYYRAGNSTHYNSLELRPSKKGWQSAVIPASQVSGKALQYYVEVRDGHGAVAAVNGKPASPNILSLRHPTPTARVARGTSSGGERKQAVLIQR